MTAQVAAETLGCSLSRVRVIAADTDLTPIDIGSYSSRVTFMAGNATLRAAAEIKKLIRAAAAKKMGCEVEELVFRDDEVKKARVGAGDSPAQGQPAQNSRGLDSRGRLSPHGFSSSHNSEQASVSG